MKTLSNSGIKRTVMKCACTSCTHRGVFELPTSSCTTNSTSDKTFFELECTLIQMIIKLGSYFILERWDCQRYGANNKLPCPETFDHILPTESTKVLVICDERRTATPLFQRFNIFICSDESTAGSCKTRTPTGEDTRRAQAIVAQH